jgi:hypothetical protein
MKQQINEIKRMQQLAGILKENNNGYEEFMDKNYPGFKPEGEQSFVKFVNLVAKNIFSKGVDDPTMAQVNDWDTLFEYWNDFGDLSLHTKSDIIQMAEEVGVSQEDIDYILDLPQVFSMESGILK